MQHTIKDLQKLGRSTLAAFGAHIAALETDLLLTHVLGVPRITLMIEPTKSVSETDAKHFADLLAQRAAGKPMAYLLGYKEFLRDRYRVREGVLIPRDDTETVIRLAEAALSNDPKRDPDRRLQALELGVGSGIISLSLIAQLPNLQMLAVDLNPEALDLTEENAKQLADAHGKEACAYLDRLTLIHSDMLEQVPLAPESLDFVISNPPYIDTAVIETLDKTVRDYEPHLALDGGADGLDAYRALLMQAMPYVRRGGFFCFEIGYDQGARLRELMKQSGLTRIDLSQDLAGKDRAIIGYKE